jgi:esterase
MFHILIAMLVLVLCGVQTVLAGPWELPVGVKALTVNGYPMAYLESGEGHTIVLVHGAGVDYRTWRIQTAKPPAGFRLIAVSLRHYYPEPWNGRGETLSIQQHADDLVAFVEGLRVGPVFVIGHSRGGVVAFRMAQARPDLIRRLILMEPAFGALLPSSAPATDGSRFAAVRKAVEARFEQGDIEGGLEVWSDRNTPGTWKRSSEEFRQIARDNAWTLIAAQQNVPVRCEELAHLKMPVLLMQGEKTSLGNTNIVEASHKCLPSAARAVIPNASHGMHVNNSAGFEAAFVTFLSH